MQASHRKAEASGDVASPLASELNVMAGWLGLERIAVESSGDLASVLVHALA